MWSKKNIFLLLLCAAFNVIFGEEAAVPNEAPAQLLPLAVNGVNPSVVISTTPSPEETAAHEYLKNCFYAEAKLCLDFSASQNETNTNGFKNDVNGCQCRPHPNVANSWYCCNITQMSSISSCSNINWINLHIINASIAEIDLSNSIYPTLHSLAITDGNITQLVGSFSRMSSIKCLNISNNNLSAISQRALKGAPNLKYLDISNNNLTRIPKLNQNQNITVDMSMQSMNQLLLFSQQSKLKHYNWNSLEIAAQSPPNVYPNARQPLVVISGTTTLCGNKHMLCSDLLDTIFRDSIKFVDPDTSYCLMNYTYNWFNSTDYVSIKELEMAGRFQTECPVIPDYGNCTCSREQMLIMGDQSKPSAKLFCRVDCSNLGLVELPPRLPENTFSLNISNNNITSIGKHFHNNPTYWNIVKLYADNNQISSMYELEGTKFMDQFQRLYLRNNALTKLPVYLLTNVLVDSDVGRNIFLAGNKLQCDCNSAKVLKRWLLERSRDIPDYTDILCRNMPQRVMELQEMKLCQSPHDWTDYIYYLIATEVILLLALITKVSYDYWVFKTAGYLPWPASKMPKLPCDWLCES